MSQPQRVKHIFEIAFENAAKQGFSIKKIIKSTDFQPKRSPTKAFYNVHKIPYPGKPINIKCLNCMPGGFDYTVSELKVKIKSLVSVIAAEKGLANMLLKDAYGRAVLEGVDPVENEDLGRIIHEREVAGLAPRIPDTLGQSISERSLKWECWSCKNVFEVTVVELWGCIQKVEQTEGKESDEDYLAELAKLGEEQWKGFEELVAKL